MEARFKLDEIVWFAYNEGSEIANLDSETMKFAFTLKRTKIVEVTHKYVDGKPSFVYITKKGHIIWEAKKWQLRWFEAFKTKEEALAWIQSEYPKQVQREFEDFHKFGLSSRQDIHKLKLIKAGKTELVIKEEKGER